MEMIKLYNDTDEPAVCKFFEQLHFDCNKNPSRAGWELICGLPCFSMFQMEKSAIGYEDNEIVAFVRPNSPWLGNVTVDNRSDSMELLHKLIIYTEENLYESMDNKKHLFISVNEKEDHLKRELLKHRYEEMTSNTGLLYYDLNKTIPESVLPEGFQLKTLSEVYDFEKLNRLIWEGFQYEGSIPKYEDEVYLPRKHAWSDYNRDICSVVIAQDGSYVSFAGFWYDKNTKSGGLEPMVTAERYRGMGLGKACVLHSLGIMKALGCGIVFVEPDEEPYSYYCKIGFEKQEYTTNFQKELM